MRNLSRSRSTGLVVLAVATALVTGVAACSGGHHGGNGTPTPTPTLTPTPTPGPPTITAFYPTAGVAGIHVRVVGANLAGASIDFGGTAATPTNDTADEILANVPAGAPSGVIGVTTSSGNVSSAASFTVLTLNSTAQLVVGPAVPGYDAYEPIQAIFTVPIAPLAGTHLALYPEGADSTSYLEYENLTQLVPESLVDFPGVSSTGGFFFRALDNSNAVLGSSALFTIDFVASNYSIVPDSATYATNAPVTIAFKAPSWMATSAFVGLFAPGTPDDLYLDYSVFPAGATSGTVGVVAPGVAGSYELRLFPIGGHHAEMTVPITVN